MQFLVADQGIGNISEGALNRLPVSDQGGFMLRLCKPQISAERSSRKNGLAHLCSVGPDSNLRGHQARESAAPSKRPSTGSSQRDLRKELRLGDPDFGVRGDQYLLGLANIGPALDQRGWHSRRHFGRKRLFHQRAAARHGLWVVAKENADGIFFLRNLPLQVRDLSVRRIKNLLSLQNIKLCGHAMI